MSTIATRHAPVARSMAPSCAKDAAQVESHQPRIPSAEAATLADETATLAIIVNGLRRLRAELDRAATIDALGTPGSYRLAQVALDELTGDLAAMLDGREWADIDGRRAA